MHDIRKPMPRMDAYTIGKRLEQAIKKGEDSFCEYLDNASDDTIAKELGVAKSRIQRLRRKHFGELLRAKVARPVLKGLRVSDNRRVGYRLIALHKAMGWKAADFARKLGTIPQNFAHYT